MRAAKNNVKFNLDGEILNGRSAQEAIYENLKGPKDDKATKAHSESQTAGKRTYLDLSRAGHDAPSSIQNSSEFMLVLYPNKESKSSTSKFNRWLCRRFV